jgi:hypothetical protein
MSSTSALMCHLRRLASDNPTIPEAAEQCSEEIVLGLNRELQSFDDGAVDPGRIINVQFADFMRDPFSTIRSIYENLGRELSPTAESLMREHLLAHPGDGGGNRYAWTDTGLDAGELREKVWAYQERFDVPSEELR